MEHRECKSMRLTSFNFFGFTPIIGRGGSRISCGRASTKYFKTHPTTLQIFSLAGADQGFPVGGGVKKILYKPTLRLYKIL